MWMKACDGPTRQQSQNIHRVVLAYESDLQMATSVLTKYPEFQRGFTASLDHSIWFHTTVKGEQWHLFVNECEHALGETALNVCRYDVVLV